MKRSEIKVGQRIGRLTFLQFAEKYWVFQCDCGKMCFRLSADWSLRSCGCYSKELREDYNTTKGYRLVRFCPQGHDTYLIGRYKNKEGKKAQSVCKQCSKDKAREYNKSLKKKD